MNDLVVKIKEDRLLIHFKGFGISFDYDELEIYNEHGTLLVARENPKGVDKVNGRN